jgi:hypothetical protein
MRPIGLAALALVLSGFIAGCAPAIATVGGQPEAYRDSLMAARERWNRGRIVSYLIQVRRECDCPGERQSPKELRQINRRIGSTVHSPFDVDGLLERVERAIDDTLVRIDTLRFDPDYGVPLLLHTSRERIVVDSFSVRFGEGWDIDSMMGYRNRIAGRTRMRYLDSLLAARKRWERAGVIEYDIQAHSECFCFGGENRGETIYTVRDNRVVAERQGKPLRFRMSFPVIARDMFAAIEEELRKDQTIVKKLEFHPELGLPMSFENDYLSGVTDSWYRMQVDTLIVRERRPRRRTP